MGKSYRKPWGTVCRVKQSAHDDKTLASRAVRRAQEQSLREAIRDEDWDGWLIPERHECTYNNVWSWARDGKQRPLDRRWGTSQYNNPYAYITSPTFWTEEQIVTRWYENMQHDDEFIAYASRK